MKTPSQTGRYSEAQVPESSPAHTTGPASLLTVTLFGACTVRLSDGTLLPPLRTRKGFYLLALLALRAGKEIDRSWLASTLWPVSEERQALGSLRRTLTDLRAVLGDSADCLTSPTAHTLCIDLSRGVWVDTTVFDMATKRGSTEALQEAIMLYTGPLLEGCDEEWVFPEREMRMQTFLMALETLTQHALIQKSVDEAVRYLRRIVAADPLRETAQRTLMETLAQQGSLAAAIQVYRDLRLYLHRELNAEPAPETQSLYQELRRQARKASHLTPAPPLESQNFLPAGLPCPLTNFIGRQEEIGQINRHLDTARLVSLTGTGGVGKTRLAIEIARARFRQYSDGVWFVDLARLSDPLLVPQTVARTLKIREETDFPLVETLLTALCSRHLLLILDNCEHLLDACAVLTVQLLAACPDLRILTTSRQALGIGGEIALRVASLSLPGPDAGSIRDRDPIPGLIEFDAVRLFVDRAVLASSSFRLTRENAEAVLKICCQLDGIPLALELAAARIKMLSAAQIAERLNDLFHLLTGGSKTTLTRQQTLKAAIDWSYQLLTDAEQALYRRLSVFAGGWTLEAAEAVCVKEIGDVPPFESWEVLNLLTALTDKSLVMVMEGSTQEIRYWLLETGRQYSRERLLEAGEEESVRGLHRDHYLELAEEAEPLLFGTDQAKWLLRLESEHDNLSAALAWSVETEARLRLAGALWRYWYVRGYFGEGRGWLAGALEQGRNVSPAVRVKALGGAGILAAEQSDFAVARVYLEEHTAIMRRSGNKHSLAHSLNNLGRVLMKQEDFAGARPLLESSLAIKRELKDLRGVSQSLGNLGIIAFAQKEYGTARRLHQESLAISRPLCDVQSIGWALFNLGTVALRENHPTEAMEKLTESLTIYAQLEDRRSMAECLLAMAEVEASCHRMERVACLIGAARAQYEAIDTLLPPVEHERSSSGAAAMDSLGETAFTIAWQKGHDMTLEQAVAYALDMSTSPGRATRQERKTISCEVMDEGHAV